MDEYDMLEVWKGKLYELKLQKELMIMDKQFSKKDIDVMDEVIRQVKKEYAKALVEKQKEEKENGKRY